MSFTLVAYLEFIAIFILLGWGTYLVWRVGQVYNGAVFTMAIGAFFSAYVVRDLGWPFGLALIAAVGIGALAAFVLALRMARMPAFTVAITTIAAIFIAQTVIRNLEFLGGAHGFFNIPEVEYLLPMSYVALVIIGFFIYRLDHSRLGRAMEVIFVDPDIAASLGIDTYRLRIFLQVAAGAMGALAGVFYAFAVGTIHPINFGLSILLSVFCFVFIGGYTTMWGVVVFAPILWAVGAFLPLAIAAWKDIIFGSLLIIILILRPEGVIDKNVVRAISTGSQAWLRQVRGLRKSQVLGNNQTKVLF